MGTKRLIFGVVFLSLFGKNIVVSKAFIIPSTSTLNRFPSVCPVLCLSAVIGRENVCGFYFFA